MLRSGAGDGHRPPAGTRLASGGARSGENPTPLGEGGPFPLALYRAAANAYALAAVCEEAEALGLRPGHPLAEARARFPAIAFEEIDDAADRRLLGHVADWCDRYTPLVAFDGDRGLFLDITGCAHLFGDERALLSDCVARLRRQGLAAEAAIAPHPATARALVLGSGAGGILLPGEEERALAPLPAGALGLSPETVALLRRLGLKTVGDLLALPRASLARRLGAPFMRMLDEALGRAETPISPRRPLPLLRREQRLFEPVSRTEDVLALCRGLAERLERDLVERLEGARRLELALFRLDGKVERIELRTVAPLRDPERIARLFAERVKGAGDELDAGFGYDLLRLAVLEAGALLPVQIALRKGPGEAETVETLLDRLAARLGEAAVQMLEPAESHWPERSQIRVLVTGDARSAAAAGKTAFPLRPLRLLERPEEIEATAPVPEGAPEQFRWRRTLYRVRRVEGPERIAPEWWRSGCEDVRDYWRVEDENGRRYWLFRRGSYEALPFPLPIGDGEMFRDGAEDPAEAGHAPSAFEAPGTAPAMRLPTWYLHGIFA